MVGSVGFAMTRKVNRENGVLPGKRFQIQAPAERSAEQSVQQ